MISRVAPAAVIVFALVACAAAREATPLGDAAPAVETDAGAPSEGGSTACDGDACTPTCAPPLVMCGARGCIDVSHDPASCGACDQACFEGQACVGGSCCATGNSICAGACVSTKNDPANCGACGAKCPAAGMRCNAGQCVCPVGTERCGATCVSTATDAANCGACGRACPSAGMRCTSGTCACAPGEQVCGGACTDTKTDPANCAACGTTCGTATPRCSGGACVGAVGYSESFEENAAYTALSPQCKHWVSFQRALRGVGTFTSITISGSNDPAGVTCTGAAADTLCTALHTSTAVTVTCNGKTWRTGACIDGFEISADVADVCVCAPGRAYTLRPCVGAFVAWGGVASQSCNGPDQTMAITCQ